MDRPLKERMFGSASAEPEPLSSFNRPFHYKAYADTKLFKAYEAYCNGMSIRMAAEAYGVPRSMLSDRVSGNVAFGARSGPTTYLTDSEEVELVHFLAHCAQWDTQNQNKTFYQLSGM